MNVQRLKRGAYYAVLWLVSLLFVAPVLWIVLASFKQKNDLLAVPPKLIFTPTLANYVELFHRQSLLLQIGNSIFLSVASVSIAVLVSFLAAFCFSRFRPKGTDFLMFLLLSIRMLPGTGSHPSCLSDVRRLRLEGHASMACPVLRHVLDPFLCLDFEGFPRWRLRAF